MSAPIEPQDFTHGPKVIDIGDLRIARGLTRRPHAACKHLKVTYDTTERRCWCRDCETEVEPFDAFTALVEWHSAIEDRIRRYHEAEKHTLISRAAKSVDEAWRSRTMAPCCPHCHAVILPEDVVGGLSMHNKELEVRRRAARAKQGGDHA